MALETEAKTFTCSYFKDNDSNLKNNAHYGLLDAISTIIIRSSSIKLSPNVIVRLF